MTIKETAKLLAVIKEVYPNFNGRVETWHMVIGDIPYDVASAATMAYIRTEHYPPVPADLIEKASLVQKANNPTTAELWGKIRKAIGNGIYHSVSEFEALPKICQRAVGSHKQLQEWAVLGEELDTVVASNVKRTLDSLLETQEELDKISPEYRAMLAKGSDKPLIGG